MDERMLAQVLADSMALDGITNPAKQAAYAERFMEPLDIVDDTGTVIGQSPRGLAHRLGLRHRTVFVMIEADGGKLLLQRRGLGAGSSPLKLDVSVGGHVVAGEEDLGASAAREMEEELGIAPDQERLEFVCEYNRTSPGSRDKSHERNRERRLLFRYALTAEEQDALAARFPARFSHTEVSGIGWFDVDEVLGAVGDGRAADGLSATFPYWLRFSSVWGR